MVYGHPSRNRNPYNGYLTPYQWLDDHPLLWETKPCFDHRTYNIFVVTYYTITYV